ncbi:MAG: hypothetical protein R2940_16995 [Syntrophotaleaceae bacterium]
MDAAGSLFYDIMKNSGNRTYQRLPGKKTGLYRRARLWMGGDHLLAVDSNIYQERYQRYYFKDIQGIVIQKTKRGRIFNGIFGVVLALAAALSLQAWFASESVWVVFWAILGSCFLVILLGNTALGPTCICRVRMPISTNELPSLHRLRLARKVRDRIREKIEQTQGRLTSEQILHSTSPPSRSLSSLGMTPGSGTRQEMKVDPPVSLWAHWSLFATALLTGAFCVLYLFRGGPVLAWSGLLLGSLLVVLNIIALSRQARKQMPGAAKTSSWIVMGVIFAGGILVYFGMIITMLKNGEVEPMFNQWSLYSSMAAVRPIDVPFLTVIFIVLALCLFLASLIGTVSLASWQPDGGR